MDDQKEVKTRIKAKTPQLQGAAPIQPDTNLYPMRILAWKRFHNVLSNYNCENCCGRLLTTAVCLRQTRKNIKLRRVPVSAVSPTSVPMLESEKLIQIVQSWLGYIRLEELTQAEVERSSDIYSKVVDKGVQLVGIRLVRGEDDANNLILFVGTNNSAIKKFQQRLTINSPAQQFYLPGGNQTIIRKETLPKLQSS